MRRATNKFSGKLKIELWKVVAATVFVVDDVTVGVDFVVAAVFVVDVDAVFVIVAIAFVDDVIVGVDFVDFVAVVDDVIVVVAAASTVVNDCVFNSAALVVAYVQLWIVVVDDLIVDVAYMQK